MNPIDDMFRRGLEGRSGDVPADLWARVQAGRGAPAPEGEALDKLFADGLKDHAGQVPDGMWSRIAATGLPAAAVVDQIFADGLKDRIGEVPAGTWDRIWKARAAGPRFGAGRWVAVAATLLLLLVAGWWLVPGADDAPATHALEVAAERVAIREQPENNAGPETVTAITGKPRQPGDYDAGKAEAGVEVFRPANEETSNPQTTTGDSPQSQAQATAVAGRPAGPVRLTGAETAATNDLTQAAGSTAPAKRSPLPVIEAGGEANFTTATGFLPILATPTTLTYEAGPAEIRVKGRYRPKPSNDRAFRAAPRHRFQTELLFGAAYADQQLTAATAADRPLSTLREVSEFPELSYQASLRGAYNLGKRLTLLGGLTYAEIRNQFEFERTVNGTTSLIRTNNTLRMLEAPLLLGYRMPGRRLQVALNAGPVVNLSTSARGSFLDPDSPQPLDLAVDGNYRRNVGVGFMTSLSTTYQIGKKEPFVLLVEPFFKAYPTAFTTRDARVKETYWVAGLQLGVRKGF